VSEKSGVKSPTQKVFICLAATLVLATVPLAQAQQPGKVYRIGFLSPGSATTSVPSRSEEGFRRGLRELGWMEGQNIVIEYRFAEGKTERFPELALELVQHNVDCIVSWGVAATRAAKEATSAIPIVMGNADDDPVRQGLVASLAQPGGNVTGFTNIGSELAGKRLELLKDIVPKLLRLGILSDSRGSVSPAFIRETQAAAKALGVQVQSLGVRGPEHFENAFRGAIKDRTDALIVVGTGLMVSQRARVIELANKTRLPAMYSNSSFALAGGLVSYASDDSDRYRGVATYVDKVLKGTKPADLPVMQPKKFELVINLKTAKQIGLTIPPNVLARADKVIR
jgi:putative tryptophan/tyrosine transport system substrate-binding protein